MRIGGRTRSSPLRAQKEASPAKHFRKHRLLVHYPVPCGRNLSGSIPASPGTLRPFAPHPLRPAPQPNSGPPSDKPLGRKTPRIPRSRALLSSCSSPSSQLAMVTASPPTLAPRPRPAFHRRTSPPIMYHPPTRTPTPTNYVFPLPHLHPYPVRHGLCH